LNDLDGTIAVVAADGAFKIIGHCVYSSPMTSAQN
jgi:hypothetical protein